MNNKQEHYDASDIQVLEVMLKQDGLTEDGIHADQKEPMLKL